MYVGYVCMHLMEVKKNLPSTQMKKTNFFTHKISQKCKHFTSLHYVFCLSQSVKYRSVQARSRKISIKHADNTLTTSYETE